MLRRCSSLFHLSSPHLPVSRLAARPLLVVHLLVVCSLLFSAVAAATPHHAPINRIADIAPPGLVSQVIAAREPSAQVSGPTSARTQPSATDMNQLQPFLNLAATVSPEAAAAGERVLLRWEVTNLDRGVVEGITFQADLPDGLLVTPADVSPPLVYDAATRRLTWVIAALPAGDAHAATVPARLSGRRVGDVVTVRGKKGAPNVWDIPEDLHKKIHSGPGGGRYNQRWIEEIKKLKEITPEAILEIRDRRVKEFDLDPWRPQ